MTEYFDQYYKDNKDRILSYRRNKYKTDVDYRKSQQERARNRARKLAEQKREERKAANIKKAKLLETTKISLADYSSQQVKRWPLGTVVTPSVVADYLGISVGTLSNWINNKVIPPPTLTVGSRNMLFSEEYLEMIRESRIYSLYNNLPKDDFKTVTFEKYERIKESEKLYSKGLDGE